MNTVEETRRIRLRMLVEEHGGMANLCEKLGYARNATAALTRILNANVRHERGGKLYKMGSPMARQIEQKLNLAEGLMDTPPNYAELHHDDRIAHVMLLMEGVNEWQRDQAMKVVDALAQPENGTDKPAP